MDKRKAKKSAKAAVTDYRHQTKRKNTLITDSAAQGKTTMQLLSASNNGWIVFGICVFLLIIIWIVFGQTLHHEFVNFDDDVYVYKNSTVQDGLPAKNIVWAFTHIHALYWHPLTTLFHMLDCQLYGLNAGGHHLTNVLLHAGTAILLFLILRQLTAAAWPSAVVAAVFAIHPLRVESVAWVAERKDVLSGLFFMLTLGAYIHYARKPWSLLRYLPVPVLFAFGLMSKPMLVTLPFVLLLLDYWPLHRFKSADGNHFSVPRRLVVEKIPLLLLSAAMGVTTLLVQARAMPVTEIPLSLRISNVLVSSAAYVGQLFYPLHLAVLYPFPAAGHSRWKIALSLLLLVAVSVSACRWRQKRPYLLVGWLWYLIMLLPVIGLVQVGAQARADRFTYLPEIGLCLSLTWAMVELSASWRNRRAVLGISTAIVLTTLITVAHKQTACWHDSESLWNHAIACTTNNAIAENNLANALLSRGRFDEAIIHSQAAIKIDPHDEDAQCSLGLALFSKGQFDEAISHYREALTIKPDFVTALNNLGMVLLQTGQPDEAIANFQQALKTEPDNADIQNNLGGTLMLRGQAAAAVVHFQRAIELKPDLVGANSNLAWLLATSPNDALRNGMRAVQLAQHANQISGTKDAKVLHTLAAAYAEAGRFSEAIETAGQALQLSKAQANTILADKLQAEIKFYQTGRPFRDTSQTP